MNKTIAFSVIITSVILVSGTLGFVLSSPDAYAAPAPKITICHIPPGNPANPQTITISVSATLAHFTLHPGDSFGSCNADSQCVEQCLFKAVRQCFPGQTECIIENVVAVSACVEANCEP